LHGVATHEARFGAQDANLGIFEFHFVVFGVDLGGSRSLVMGLPAADAFNSISMMLNGLHSSLQRHASPRLAPLHFFFFPFKYFALMAVLILELLQAGCK